MKEKIVTIIKRTLEIKNSYDGGNYSVDTVGDLENVILDGDYDFTETIEELSTLIQQEREEAVKGFYKWYMEHPATMSNKPMVEQYLQSLDKGEKDENR